MAVCAVLAGKGDEPRAVTGWWILVAVSAGVATGVATPVRAPSAMAVAVACASAAILVERAALRRILVAAACAAAATTHGARARDRVIAAPARILSGAAASGGSAPAIIHGVLAADVVRTETGARLEVRLAALEHVSGRRVAATGRVQAHVAGALVDARMLDWRAGRVIRAPATLRAPGTWHNPGGPSPRWQALQRGADVVASIKSAALVEADQGRAWHEAAAAVRAHVRAVAARYVAPRHPQSAAVVTAVLIGDRAGLAEDVELRLQAAGTYHVIAISGGNVALLTGLVWLAVRTVIRGHRPAILTALAAVLGYGFVVGGDPSVTRAVAVAAVYLTLAAAGVVASLLRVLVVVAAATVVIDPLATVEVGAWLSYGATVGILLCAAPFVRFAQAATRPGARWPRRLGLASLALLAATVAAEVSLLPIAAGVFGRVGVAGLALNFIAIPAMAVVQVAGLAMVVTALVSSTLAAWCAMVVDAGARMIVDTARLVDVVPWLSWRVPPAAPLWTVLYYAAGGLALAGRARPWCRRGATGVWLACLAVLSTSPFTARRGPAPDWLRLTMIDVGQGDAVLVQVPGGAALLVDGGGVIGRFDIGDRVVTRAVWGLGVRRLDWLLMTHPDLDHAGGLPTVVRALRPREVWEGVPVTTSAEWRAVRQEAALAGAHWRRLQAGDAIEVGPVQLVALHPPPPDWERRRTRNDDSVVLRVRYGEVEFVLPGDIGSEVEATLAAVPLRAPLRVMKVAHHGSRSSSSARWLDQEAPHLALVSAGRDNLFGHPAPVVIERLRASGAAIFRTDEDGAVMVETNGREVHVRTMSGRTWGLRRWP